MQYASNVLHLHQIYAIVAESNQNAVKILEVVGFQGDKLLKGWLKTGRGYEDAYFFNLFCKNIAENLVESKNVVPLHSQMRNAL